MKHSILFVVVTLCMMGCMIKTSRTANNPVEIIPLNESNIPTPLATVNKLSENLFSSTSLTKTTALTTVTVSSENIANLTLAERWGKGQLRQVTWRPTNQSVAVLSRLGIYIYDSQTLSQRSFFELKNESLDNVLLSPDGSLLAFGTGHPDYSVELWQLQNGQQLRTINWPQNSHIYGVAFSPDSKTLALANESTIELFEIETGKCLTNLIEPEGVTGVSEIRFSPTSPFLASYGWNDDLVRIWNTDTGQVVNKMQAPYRVVTSLAYHPNGQILAVGGYGNVIMWQTNPQQMLEFPSNFASPPLSEDLVFDIAFNPDGNLLAIAGNLATLYIADIETEQILHRFESEVNDVVSLAFSPDGSKLVSGSIDGQVQFWDVTNGQIIDSITDHANVASEIFFSADGSQMISAHANTIRIWNVETKELSHISVVDQFEVTDMAIHSRLPILAASSVLKVKVWDIETNQLLNELPIGGASIALTPNSQIIALGNFEGVIELKDIQTSKTLTSFVSHSAEISSLEFNPQETLLASSSRHESQVKLWNFNTGELVSTIESNSGPIQRIAFNHKGDMLATISSQNISLWNVITNELLYEVEMDTRVLAFSRDDSILATNSNVLDAYTGTKLWESKIKGVTVAFTPDGTKLVIGDEYGQINFFEIKNEK